MGDDLNKKIDSLERRKKYHKEYYKKYYLKNKNKMLDNNKKWQQKNKKTAQKRALKNTLKSKYNLSLEDYEKMILEQDNLCAICQNRESVKRDGEIRRLSVDHCHETDKVRGLLCHHCNVGLGGFKDNMDYLNNAISYLKKYK